MKLHNFFRSGTSHRLRIALNLKGVPYEYVAVDLRSEQHLAPAYKALNPQGLVPALEVDGRVLTQSPAIIEWLEERFPTPPLLPAGIDERARVRALAAIVGCDIHPLNNRRVLETPEAHAATGRSRGERVVRDLDRRRASTLSKRCLQPTPNAARSASATRRRWPMSTWCRRLRARAVSRSTSRAGRACRRSTPPVPPSTPLPAPPRRCSRDAA